MKLDLTITYIVNCSLFLVGHNNGKWLTKNFRLFSSRWIKENCFHLNAQQKLSSPEFSVYAQGHSLLILFEPQKSHRVAHYNSRCASPSPKATHSCIISLFQKQKSFLNRIHFLRVISPYFWRCNKCGRSTFRPRCDYDYAFVGQST